MHVLQGAVPAWARRLLEALKINERTSRTAAWPVAALLQKGASASKVVRSHRFDKIGQPEVFEHLRQFIRQLGLSVETLRGNLTRTSAEGNGKEQLSRRQT
jgi:hypothetical protein